MAADYKNRNTRPRRRKGPPAWIWFASGLLVGLFFAFLFYLKGAQVLPAASAPPTEAALTTPASKPAQPASKPAPEPEPEQPALEFKFYDMLPDMEIPVSDVEVDPKRNRNAAGGDSYLLQVAAFRNEKDADRLKARLTLQGLDAQIQRVLIDDKHVWYRVRTGPYQQLAEMEQARNHLRGEGLQPMPLKIPKP